MTYGLYLKKLRENEGLTQKQLAEVLQVSLINIKKIETNQTKNPTPKMIKGLSNYLNETPEKVLKDIFFFDELDYAIKLNFSMQCYIAYKYKTGWGFTIGESYKSNLVGKVIIPVLLSKKREMDHYVVAQTFDRNTMGIDPQNILQYFVNDVITLCNLENFPLVRELHYVFDTKDKDIYDSLQKIKLNWLKIEIKLVLNNNGVFLERKT